MQLFGLHTDPVKAAQLLCNTHVVKMASEGHQIMVAALSLCGVKLTGEIDCTAHGKGIRQPWKVAYRGHPLAHWTAACINNFEWTLAYTNAVLDEYSIRYNRTHLTSLFVNHLSDHLDKNGFPTAMPRTITAEHWLDDMAEKMPNKVAEWSTRIAKVSPPDGCSFGYVAIKGFESSETQDWVAAYHKCYELKRSKWANKEKRPIIMMWDKKTNIENKRQKL